MPRRSHSCKQLESELRITRHHLQQCKEKLDSQVLVNRDLQSEYDRYRQAFCGAEIGVARVGLDGQLLHVNSYFCQMLGYDERELMKRRIPDIINEKERDNDLRVAELVLSGEVETLSFVRNYVGKENKDVWGATIVSVIQDEKCRPCCFLVIVHDVSRQRATEEKLRTYEESLDSVFRIAPIGIGLLNDRRITIANNSLCSLVGYEPAQLIGAELDKLFEHTEESERIYRELKEKSAVNCVSSLETRFLCRDGEKKNVLVNFTKSRSKGSTREIVFTALDISEQLHTQEKLREQAHELVEVNTTLRVLIKQADEAKAKMIENMRTKISCSIKPYLDMLSESGLSDRQFEILGMLSANFDGTVEPVIGSHLQILDTLTPMQNRIAELIKQGKSSKEIADILNVSVQAVSYHRGKLRKKFELTDRKVSLQAFLLQHSS